MSAAFALVSPVVVAVLLAAPDPVSFARLVSRLLYLLSGPLVADCEFLPCAPQREDGPETRQELNSFGSVLALTLRVRHVEVLHTGLRSLCRTRGLRSGGKVVRLPFCLALVRHSLSAHPGLDPELRALLLMAPPCPLTMLPHPAHWHPYLPLARLAHLPLLTICAAFVFSQARLKGFLIQSLTPFMLPDFR